MEEQDLSPSQVQVSRPFIGFPLGTALLLLLFLILSGIFSFCYHWDKFRTLRTQSLSHHHPQHTHTPTSNSKPNPTTGEKKGQSLPVLMPGDEVPKFIAMPCPCQLWRPEEIIVTVEKAPSKPRRLPVPLY